MVGIDLASGTHLFGSAGKIRLLLPALHECLLLKRLRPLDLAALLGLIQWMDLLQRPLLSILSAADKFARREDQLTCQDLPLGVQRELASVLALAVYWQFDLTKPWSADIFASDASTGFGFGVCRLRSTSQLARQLGRLSEKRGDHVTFLHTDGQGPLPKVRLGSPHELPISLSDFGVLISCRTPFGGHASLLEAHALRLTLEWIGRSSALMSRGIVILVDSKAVLGAAAKGRSSSGLLQRLISRISALTLALDLSIHLLYVPSEHNPADWPSRGVPLPRRHRVKHGFSR